MGEAYAARQLEVMLEDFTIDDDFIFQGNSVVVATGQIIDRLKLVDGSELPTTARWTATLAASDEG